MGIGAGGELDTARQIGRRVKDAARIAPEGYWPQQQINEASGKGALRAVCSRQSLTTVAVTCPATSWSLIRRRCCTERPATPKSSLAYRHLHTRTSSIWRTSRIKHAGRTYTRSSTACSAQISIVRRTQVAACASTIPRRRLRISRAPLRRRTRKLWMRA